MGGQLYQDLFLTILMVLPLVGPAHGNLPPVLTTKRGMVITGSGPAGRPVTAALQGNDPDNDHFTYRLKTPPPQKFINITTLSLTGILTFKDICDNCTGTILFEIEMEDTEGNAKTYKLTITFKDRSKGNLKLISENPKKSGMLRWHIYLIILAAIVSVGVIASLVMYNCCTFQTDIYSAPIRRPNKIVDKSEPTEEKTRRMNPFARPRKMSLIVRESVRSGAADGAPYYGVRRSGVWIPNAPEDTGAKGEPVPLRLMSISEDPEVARMRAASIAPIRSSHRLDPLMEQRINVDRKNLDDLSWQQISTPRV